MASKWKSMHADSKNFNIFSITGKAVKPFETVESKPAELKDQIVQIPYRYLQYGSLMHLIPYDVRWSNEGFKLNSTKGARRVFIIILYLCSDVLQVKGFIQGLRSTQITDGSNSASPITSFVDQLVSTIWKFYYIAFRYLLWTRREHFEKLLNSLSELEQRMRNELGAKSPSVSAIRRATVFFVAYPFFEAIWSLAPKFHEAYAPLLHGSHSGDSWPPAVTWGMTIAETVIKTFTMFADSFALSMVLMNAWVLKLLGRTFIEHLRSRGETPMSSDEEEKATDICIEMLDFSEKLEEAIGFFVFAFCFALMPNNSFHLMRAFTQDWATKVKTIMFTVTYVCALCTSADANLILKDFSSLLMVGASESSALETKEEFEEEMFRMEQLRILLHRISSNGFGIKGHAFTITYGFVGNLAGLILTYAIIIIQFQGSSS